MGRGYNGARAAIDRSRAVGPRSPQTNRREEETMALKGQWFVRISCAVVLAGAALGLGSGSAAGTGPCGLLDDPEFLGHVSGAGESALRARCGHLAATIGGAGPGPASAASNVLVNDRSTDVFSHITQSETSVAVSGTTLLAGYNDSGEFVPNGDFTGYARSVDGGSTWTDLRTPTTPLGDIDAVFGDPVLAADRARGGGRDGVFYFANLADSTSGVSVIGVHKSLDGGLTWASAANASPLAGGGEFQDKDWLAVDSRRGGPGAGNVYVCWRRFGGPGGIQFSRSTDGGATFVQIGSISQHATLVQACQVAVNPLNGEVYVAWRDGNTSPPTIRFRRSTDFGATFGPELAVGAADVAETVVACGSSGQRTAFVDSEIRATARAIRSTSFPSLAVNPATGAVLLAWHRANLPGGQKADIALSRSTDGGATFSSPVRINADVRGQQFFPALAVTPSGTVAVDYYSTQNSATDRLLDVYQVVSTDGGDTFGPPVRVTDVSFDRPITNPNFDTFVANCYMGDYIGESAAFPGSRDEGLYSAWGDNRLDGNASDAGLQPDPDVRFSRR